MANDPMTFILFLSFLQFLLTVKIFTPFFRFGYSVLFVCVVLLRFLPCMVMYWLCMLMYDGVLLCMAM